MFGSGLAAMAQRPARRYQISPTDGAQASAGLDKGDQCAGQDRRQVGEAAAHHGLNEAEYRGLREVAALPGSPDVLVGPAARPRCFAALRRAQHLFDGVAGHVGWHYLVRRGLQRLPGWVESAERCDRLRGGVCEW